MKTARKKQEWSIRRYRPEDCGEIVALFRRTVRCVNAKDYTQPELDAWAPENPDFARWDRSLQEHHALVAEDGGRIVGFGDIDEGGYLDRLYVHSDFQSRGIATQLCDALEAYAAGCGMRSVETHASITARPFFEKRGYRMEKEQAVARNGQQLINFVMQKILPSGFTD